MKASSDPGNKTVRVAASWALANLTDILLHSRDEMELTGDLIKTSEATVVIGTLLFKYKLFLIPKKKIILDFLSPISSVTVPCRRRGRVPE